MKTLGMQPSRRQFIQQLGLGAAWLGLAANTSFAFAHNTSVLPFRQNAQPLLLHYNENSLGMSPNALSAAKTAIERYGNRYPSASVDEFKVNITDKKAYAINEDEKLIIRKLNSKDEELYQKALLLRQKRISEILKNF